MVDRFIELPGYPGLTETIACIHPGAQRRLVCADTGVSHIAAALGTLSVVVSNGADIPETIDA